MLVTHASRWFAPLSRLRERGWGRGQAHAVTVTLHFVATLPSPPPLSQRERGDNRLCFGV
ncbi:protein of unknown function [Cupriavidus taiwanensis]|nr:protein of unknown function [Cupriavidus taiwanensis]